MANITYTITQDGEEISYTINDGVGPAGPNNITTATSTDITGILKGDGANVSAAVDGTDYLTPASVDARIADAINFFEDYFFTATPDALGGIYYEMKDTNGGVSADLVSGTLAAGNDQALFNFINNAGLGVSQLEGGYYELHVHASKTGTKATTIYAEIYTRTTGGTETLIGTTEVSGQLTGSDAIYDLTTRISDTPINTTDKLVVKWYANVGSAGSDVAVTIKVDGNTNSRIHVPVTTEILAQKYQAILAEGSFIDGDKTKLDGIEAGATADQTAAEILTAIKTVDGTGSGLDADLLDGQDSSAFATSAQGALADSAVQPGDIDTLAELNAIITDATLIDTTDSRLSDARTPTAHTHTASDLDFAGSTDIGADLADADEVLVSDGGGNTTRVKSALSRFWTYIKSKIESVGLSSLNITGDLTVDTNTLKVDSANNRVGIGTATPAAGYALDVSGSMRASTNVGAGNSFFFYNSGLLMYATAATDTGNAYTFSNDAATALRQVKARSLHISTTAAGTAAAAISSGGVLSFPAANSGTWDGATIAGDQTFSGQVELTGQAAITDDSAMNKGLVRDFSSVWGDVYKSGNGETDTNNKLSMVYAGDRYFEFSCNTGTAAGDGQWTTFHPRTFGLQAGSGATGQLRDSFSYKFKFDSNAITNTDVDLWLIRGKTANATLPVASDVCLALKFAGEEDLMIAVYDGVTAHTTTIDVSTINSFFTNLASQQEFMWTWDGTTAKVYGRYRKPAGTGDNDWSIWYTMGSLTPSGMSAGTTNLSFGGLHFLQYTPITCTSVQKNFIIWDLKHTTHVIVPS